MSRRAVRRRALGVAMVVALLLLQVVGARERPALALDDEPPAPAWDNGVADTPPMGWNSYDSFNWSVTEALRPAATGSSRSPTTSTRGD